MTDIRLVHSNASLFTGVSLPYLVVNLAPDVFSLLGRQAPYVQRSTDVVIGESHEPWQSCAFDRTPGSNAKDRPQPYTIPGSSNEMPNVSFFIHKSQPKGRNLA